MQFSLPMKLTLPSSFPYLDVLVEPYVLHEPSVRPGHLHEYALLAFRAFQMTEKEYITTHTIKTMTAAHALTIAASLLQLRLQPVRKAAVNRSRMPKFRG